MLEQYNVNGGFMEATICSLIPWQLHINKVGLCDYYQKKCYHKKNKKKKTHMNLIRALCVVYARYTHKLLNDMMDWF